MDSSKAKKLVAECEELYRKVKKIKGKSNKSYINLERHHEFNIHKHVKRKTNCDISCFTNVPEKIAELERQILSTTDALVKIKLEYKLSKRKDEYWLYYRSLLNDKYLLKKYLEYCNDNITKEEFIEFFENCRFSTPLSGDEKKKEEEANDEYDQQKALKKQMYKSLKNQIKCDKEILELIHHLGGLQAFCDMKPTAFQEARSGDFSKLGVWLQISSQLHKRKDFLKEAIVYKPQI